MVRPLASIVALAAVALWVQHGVAQQRGDIALRGDVRTPIYVSVSSPTIVELFTSEGCSSCPPADRLLERLERDTNIIVLGEHVDYWDELGWRDRFSSPLFTTRQQDYGTSLHSPNVYTPQAVVNGEKEVLGSDTRALGSAISTASKRPRAAVTLRWNVSNVVLTVGKLPPGSHKADVLLAITESGLESEVRAGENTGRKLRHASVVRSLTRLAEVDPAKPGEYVAEAKLNLRPEWVRSNLKVVALVQDRENRHILGAAALK